MKVGSIAECSPWSILQYFWPALSDNWSWNLIWVFFESGRFTLVFDPNDPKGLMHLIMIYTGFTVQSNLINLKSSGLEFFCSNYREFDMNLFDPNEWL